MKASSPVLGKNINETRVALDADETNFAQAVLTKENEAVLRFELTQMDMDRIQSSDRPSVFVKVSMPEGVMPNLEVSTVPPVLRDIQESDEILDKMQRAFDSGKKGTILEDYEPPTR